MSDVPEYKATIPATDLAEAAVAALKDFRHPLARFVLRLAKSVQPVPTYAWVQRIPKLREWVEEQRARTPHPSVKMIVSLHDLLEVEAVARKDPGHGLSRFVLTLAATAEAIAAIPVEKTFGFGRAFSEMRSGRVVRRQFWMPATACLIRDHLIRYAGLDPNGSTQNGECELTSVDLLAEDWEVVS